GHAKQGSPSALKKWKVIAARWRLQSEAANNTYGEICGAAELALILRFEGQYDQCLNNLGALGDRARRLGMFELLWDLRLEVATTLMKKSLFQEAEEGLRELIREVERTQNRYLMTRASLAEAELLEKMGRNAEAISSAKLAYSLAWCDGPPFSFMEKLAP